MSDELKPCPFCGGNNCGVRAGTDEIWCVCGGHSPHGWNSRPIENKLQAEIERLQKRIAELESVNEDQALTISQNDYAYAVDKEMMEAEIKASNDLLRSAFMIAKRDGKETNWEAWRKQLEIALTRQHKMMYGEKAQQALNEVTK